MRDHFVSTSLYAVLLVLKRGSPFLKLCDERNVHYRVLFACYNLNSIAFCVSGRVERCSALDISQNITTQEIIMQP